MSKAVMPATCRISNTGAEGEGNAAPGTHLRMAEESARRRPRRRETISPTVGGLAIPDAGRGGPLQSGRNPAGRLGRVGRQPVGSAQPRGVPKVLTTDAQGRV